MIPLCKAEFSFIFYLFTDWHNLTLAVF